LPIVGQDRLFQDSHARLETVKALASLFAKETFSSNAGTVTLRLAPRLIEMALRDVDLSVRVNAISVITQIDKTGILADEDEGQRTKVARLVFDAEPRVRRAIGAFMRGLWEEKAQKLQIDWEGARGNRKKRGAGISEDVMASHLEWKALAALLVETSFSLEEPTEDAGPSKAQPVFGPSTQSVMTRANAAVEALLPEIEKMQDWEGLVDYLLLDHSTVDQDMWLLDEDEENFLLQLLIACIKREDKVSLRVRRICR
jgi:cohesin complex subunit SA-1/2